MNSSIHENYVRNEAVTPSSDRTFGLMMAAVLGLLGLLNAFHEGRKWPWMLAGAVIFLAIAWLRPLLLNPLNRLWMKLGDVLHRIVNPLVMGLLFYGTVLPTGIVMRLRSKDLLRLRQEAGAGSYWIERTPGPPPETMKDQF